MDQQKLNNLAKRIIRKNRYATLATAAKEPWASPVYYCVDQDWNFYYASLLSAKHSQNILKNHRVAFAIFDSRQKEGTGNGIQGIGRVCQLKGLAMIKALRWYHTQFFPAKPATFRRARFYRLFKIVPEHVYVLDPEASVDKRVEVSLLPSVL